MTPAPRIPTVEDLTVLPTRARLPVLVELAPGVPLTFPDGAPVQLVLQAVSFEQELACNRAALKEGQKAGIGFCEDTWAFEMAASLIAEPRMTRAQLQVLRDVNAQIISLIVDAGEQLRTASPRAVTAELEQLAGLPVPPAPGANVAQSDEP